MNFDPTWLFLSLFPSGIGFVLLVYGKKEGRWPQLVAGLLFLVYPYFTDTVHGAGRRRRRVWVWAYGWASDPDGDAAVG